MSLVGTRFGGSNATVWGSSAPPAAIAAVPPATAVYGPGAVTPTGQAGVVGTNPGQLAVYFGIACLVGLVLIRQSLPK